MQLAQFKQVALMLCISGCLARPQGELGTSVPLLSAPTEVSSVPLLSAPSEVSSVPLLSAPTEVPSEATASPKNEAINPESTKTVATTGAIPTGILTDGGNDSEDAENGEEEGESDDEGDDDDGEDGP